MPIPQDLRIVITGGHGFYGPHMILACREAFPYSEIYVLDQKAPDAPSPDVAKSFIVDITSEDQVRQALTEIQPHAVIHTAGYNPPLAERYSRRIEKRLKEVNVGGTKIMLDVAREVGCLALVYTSSCCVVTDHLGGYFANINESHPLSRHSLMYGESKAEAEDLFSGLDSKHMAVCIIRPAVTFGEGDHVLIPSVHACIAKLETPFRLGDGNNLWDVVYVGNVAYAHVIALKNLLTTKTAHGEAFFIQNNEPISFREFCLACWKEFGHAPPFQISIPATFGMFVGFISEMWTWVSGSPATISRGSVLDATAMRYASGEKARTILGYEARVGLEEALGLSCKVCSAPRLTYYTLY